MAGDVVVGAAKQSPRLRLRPRLRKARSLQRSLQGPAKVARLSADSVDTKGKLSNLVTQGKAAANKLAKVVAGEQTANYEELGFEEQGCLLPGVRLPPERSHRQAHADAGQLGKRSLRTGLGHQREGLGEGVSKRLQQG